MRAHRIDFVRGSQSAGVDLGYDYAVPGLRCEACKSVNNNWAFDYPAVDYDFIRGGHFDKTKDIVLNRGDFDALLERVFAAAGRRFCLVPGGNVGMPSGKAEGSKLDDFTQGHVSPLLSKRGLELLDGEGIKLRTGEVNIVFRGKRIDTHVALQIEPYKVMTEESLREFTIEHCAECGDYRTVKLRVKVPRGIQIDRSRMPDEDLFLTQETVIPVASPRFIEAVRKHNLTGICFPECGDYV